VTQFILRCAEYQCHRIHGFRMTNHAYHHRAFIGLDDTFKIASGGKQPHKNKVTKTHRHAYTHTCLQTHIHTHTYTHTHTHTHIHKQKHTRTHTHTHAHTRIHTHTHTRSHARRATPSHFRRRSWQRSKHCESPRVLTEHPSRRASPHIVTGEEHHTEKCLGSITRQ
jgi:hypothetical protein